MVEDFLIGLEDAEVNEIGLAHVICGIAPE
jgi:hypothetical protein